MAITLNPYEQLGRIYRATSSGTSFSSDYHSSSNFDYFVDSPSVDDAIYFCSEIAGTPPFTAIKLNVGTALSGTDVVLKWEYYNTSDTWVELPDLVDNTNGFTTTGVNEVSWTLPTDVKRANVNGGSFYWIRCRLHSFTSISEGGANATDIPTYNMYGIQITGGTSTTPITLEDIYQADVAGGWGVIEKAGDYAYRIKRNFYVGDGSTETHFRVRNTAMIVDGHVRFSRKSYNNFGTLVNSNDKSVKDGCFFYATGKILMANHFRYVKVWTIYGGETNGYDSIFKNWGSDAHFNKLYGCIFEGRGNFVNYDFTDYTRVNFSSLATALWVKNGIINDVKVTNSNYVARVWMSSGDDGKTYDLIGVKGVGNDNAFQWWGGSYPTADLTIRFVDCDIENWGIYWVNDTITNGKLKRCYTIGLLLLDEYKKPLPNARVKLTNGNGDEVFSVITDANGQITDQIVTSYKYTRESGQKPGITATTDYNPFTLIIEKSGYKTYKTKFDLTEKTNLIISLKPNKFRETKSR